VLFRSQAKTILEIKDKLHPEARNRFVYAAELAAFDGDMVAAVEFVRLSDEQEKFDTAAFINGRGYSHMSYSPSQAVVLFELFVAAYPEDANAWDSLGEGHWKAGNYDQAAVAYTKSIAMDPKNEHGKTMLKRISAEAAAQ